MASVPDRNITMLEMLRLEEYILTQVDLGQSEFEAAELANEIGVHVEKIFEAMRFLNRTNDHVQEMGAGRWSIERQV